MTVLKISAAGLATLALLAGAQAHAQGVITLQSDAPAVGAAVQATQAGRAQAAKPPAQMPGINRVEMPPVSPEDSEAAIRAHPVPANLNPGVQPRAAQASTPAQRVAGDAAPAAPVARCAAPPPPPATAACNTAFRRHRWSRRTNSRPSTMPR